MVAVERVERWLERIENLQKKVKRLSTKKVVTRSLRRHSLGEGGEALPAHSLPFLKNDRELHLSNQDSREDDDSVYVELQGGVRSEEYDKRRIWGAINLCNSEAFDNCHEYSDDNIFPTRTTDTNERTRKTLIGRSSLLEGREPVPPRPALRHFRRCTEKSDDKDNENYNKGCFNGYYDVDAVDVPELLSRSRDGAEYLQGDFPILPFTCWSETCTFTHYDREYGDHWLEQVDSDEEKLTTLSRGREELLEGKPPIDESDGEDNYSHGDQHHSEIRDRDDSLLAFYEEYRDGVDELDDGILYFPTCGAMTNFSDDHPYGDERHIRVNQYRRPWLADIFGFD